MKLKEDELIHYELKLVETSGTTGYFACFPRDMPDFDTALTRAREAPNDEFMRRYLLHLIAGWGGKRFRDKIKEREKTDLFLEALYVESCILDPKKERLLKHFDTRRIVDLSSHTPLTFLKMFSSSDYSIHSRWIFLFRENMFKHRDLRNLPFSDLPVLYSEDGALPFLHSIKSVVQNIHKVTYGSQVPNHKKKDSAEDVADEAIRRLAEAGVVLGPQMRHESSLSPIALLRRWQLKVKVDSRRHSFVLEGEQTAYGRGLDFGDARAACHMEIIERLSAFPNVVSNQLTDFIEDQRLIYARASELNKKDLRFLSPQSLTPEILYSDAQIFWMRGAVRTKTGLDPILVPAQFVFLFWNLDEVKLVSAMGSTGLASGTSIETAKTKALLEVIERDCEAVTPFSPSLCFEAETSDPKIASLFKAYQERGIRVRFQDITTDLGIPCCKCFVRTQEGTLVKGTGAHLNAKKALLSALTETPFPFPNGFSSRPGLKKLLRVRLEELPDYSTKDAGGDLETLESLLLSNGMEPIYVNLTRKDIQLPVFRVLIPGMEIFGDFDRFSRVHPRLYSNYLRLEKRVTSEERT
jgi:ribosomal protein S12 methylthiotransferase accessory factor YcaO